MGTAVSITRFDLTASELRKAASGEKDSAAARRIDYRPVHTYTLSKDIQYIEPTVRIY
jgi:hypothetical protein